MTPKPPSTLLSALLPALLCSACSLVITDAEHQARLDADGDGYIAAEHGGDDCDDADATVHPGAEERCNDVDDDCDGNADEDPIDGDVFLYDADDDGFPGSSETVVACAPPSDRYLPEEGAVTDCDDGDDQVNPDADEICGNEVDEDCDGDTPVCPPIDLVDARSGEGVSSGDLYGFAVAAAGGAVVVGAPGHNGERGTATVHATVASGDIGLNSGDIVFRGTEDGARLGTAVAFVGDMLGAGSQTIAIGAPRAQEGSGAVYLLSPDRTGDVYPVQADVAVEPHLLDDLYLGSAISGAGDVTGDGRDDMLIGAPGWAEGAGAAIIMVGPLDGIIDPATGNHYWTGEGSVDDAGRSLSGAGDVDGDGVNDVLIGAWNAGDDLAGATCLLLGPIDGSGSLADADAIIRGDVGDLSGLPVAGGGDIDGDGRADIAIEAVGLEPDFGSVGETYVFAGVNWGTGPVPDLTNQATATITQDNEGDAATDVGLGLDLRTDINDDGRADLLLGQPGTNGQRGAVAVFFGPIAGSLLVSDAPQHLVGASSGDQAGLAVAATDSDGDGRRDIIVGAPGVSDDSGAIYFVPASADW